MSGTGQRVAREVTDKLQFMCRRIPAQCFGATASPNPVRLCFVPPSPDWFAFAFGATHWPHPADLRLRDKTCQSTCHANELMPRKMKHKNNMWQYAAENNISTRGICYTMGRGTEVHTECAKLTLLESCRERQVSGKLF